MYVESLNSSTTNNISHSKIIKICNRNMESGLLPIAPDQALEEYYYHFRIHGALPV